MYYLLSSVKPSSLLNFTGKEADLFQRASTTETYIEKYLKRCEIYIPKQCSRNRGNRKKSSAATKTEDFLLGSLAKVLCLSSIIILSIFLIGYPCESTWFLDVIDKLLSEYF